MYTKTIKCAFAALSACFICSSAIAQGWVTNGSNRLFPVSSSLSTTGVQIGIGTRSPSAQFHTTGTLRFANLSNNSTLNRLLVADTSGNIFFREVASLGSGPGTAGWSKTGDAGTQPETQFLGTTDNQRLVFKTNNTEQMTILPNGNIGLGTSIPSFKLQIHSNVPNKKLALTGNAPSLLLWGPGETTAPYGAVLGLATANANYATTAKTGDLIMGPLGGNAIIFNTNINFPSTGSDEKMRIEPNGNVGINVMAPTTRLHVNGTVRLENLPQGAGNALVVDANGNVFVRSTATIATNSIQPNEVQTLKAEIAQLRAELNEIRSLLGSGTTGSKKVEAKGFLSINVPNPFTSETSISYSLPRQGAARLDISDVQGKQVRSIRLGNQLNGQVTVSSLNTAGTYVYTLMLDGKAIESKKMTFVK